MGGFCWLFACFGDDWWVGRCDLGGLGLVWVGSVGFSLVTFGVVTFGWLVGWSVGWLADFFVSWLVGWLVVRSLVCWLNILSSPISVRFSARTAQWNDADVIINNTNDNNFNNNFNINNDNDDIHIRKGECMLKSVSTEGKPWLAMETQVLFSTGKTISH